MPYLADLTLRLVAGATRLPEEQLARHAAYLAAQQNADGGFAGREGASDLYYTGFGLRGLALTGRLSPQQAEAAAGFLVNRLVAWDEGGLSPFPPRGRRHPQEPEAELGTVPFRSAEGTVPISARQPPPPHGAQSGDGDWPLPGAPPRAISPIDGLSLLLSAVLLEAVSGIDVFAPAGRDRVGTLLELVRPLKQPDGGYAKSPSSGGGSSTYHNFLVAACQEWVGAPLDELPGLVQIVRRRQRADGGFSELDILATGGTNPTAAAVGLLRMAGGPTPDEAHAIAAYLHGMQNAEGGLRANGRIPLADLLSTFAGLAAFDGLRAGGAGRDSRGRGPATPDLAALRRFVLSLENPGGGFRGGLWDDRPDVEYTFYGLGALALLANLPAQEK